MRENLETTESGWLPEDDRHDQDEITVPIATICAQAGGSRNARTHCLKKKGESAPQRTLDWTDIGDPTR